MHFLKVEVVGSSIVVPRSVPHTIGAKTRVQRMPRKQANTLLSDIVSLVKSVLPLLSGPLCAICTLPIVGPFSFRPAGDVGISFPPRGLLFVDST
jgi:hypothetical protein